MHAQKFIAVTSRQLSVRHDKLMQMPGEAHNKETGTGPEPYPIIVRSFEPVADLDERLKRIFTLVGCAKSVHAAWLYSWMRPPRRSLRSMPAEAGPLMRAFGMCGAGGVSCSERCGLCVL